MFGEPRRSMMPTPATVPASRACRRFRRLASTTASIARGAITSGAITSAVFTLRP